jgi:hypothetical protein
MSLLRGRWTTITLNLSTAEIADLVRSGKADVGAMAGNPKSFKSLNPSFEILVASPLLPASLIALSPELADLDRNRLQQALIAAPDSVKGKTAANYGPGSVPDYHYFARQVAEGKAFSACLRNREGVFNLQCPGSDRVAVVEGWIDDAGPIGDQIRINMTTADQRRLTLIVDRSLLEQSSVFKTLNELRGRGLKVLTLQNILLTRTIAIESPHQLEIRR